MRLSSAKVSENAGVRRPSGSAQVFLLDSPTPPSRRHLVRSDVHADEVRQPGVNILEVSQNQD